MRPRYRYLLPLVAVLVAVVAVLPNIASSETGPAVEAVNEPGSGLYAEEHHHWSPAQVTVTAGGTVSFSNPGEVNHGVRWVTGPATPACSSGVPVGTEATASGAKWNGTCTFAQAGTYTFYCTVHPAEMHGTVTVNANGTTTTTTTQPLPPGGTTIPTPTTPSAPPEATLGSPLQGSQSKAVKFAGSQHGKSVHGSIEVSQGGVGGRLEVDLLTGGASLAKTGRSGQVRVGRLVRTSLYAGAVSVAVPLSVRARHALSAHHRLALTVKLVLTPLHGAAVKISRVVVMRP
jgi:plastocyanin